MLVQGVVRALMILACVSPSLLCFTLATYLIAHNLNEGWGWLMVIGVLALEVPKRVFKLPEECSTCHARRQSSKVTPEYEYQYQEV
jgi:hypothetical protein